MLSAVYGTTFGDKIVGKSVDSRKSTELDAKHGKSGLNTGFFTPVLYNVN
jgi:hypothetical protein